jgi:hypothetical protein
MPSAMKTEARKTPASVVNSLFLLTLPLLAYVGAIGFGTVWLRHQISVTANANKSLEVQIVEAQRHETDVSAEIAQAQTPAELLRQNTRLGLNLIQPRADQVLQVTDDVERRLAAKHFGQFFSSTDSATTAAGVAALDD